MWPPPPTTPAQDPSAQLLVPSLVFRDTMFLLRVGDVAATFPFANSNSIEAEDRLAHTEDTDMTGHTDCHREGAAFNSTYVRDSQKNRSTGSHIPFSSWAGRGKSSLVQAHTQHFLGSQIHTFMHPLSVYPAPLSGSQTSLPVSPVLYLPSSPS